MKMYVVLHQTLYIGHQKPARVVVVCAIILDTILSPSDDLSVYIVIAKERALIYCIIIPAKHFALGHNYNLLHYQGSPIIYGRGGGGGDFQGGIFYLWSGRADFLRTRQGGAGFFRDVFSPKVFFFIYYSPVPKTPCTVLIIGDFGCPRARRQGAG